jgi:hypothetical protein
MHIRNILKPVALALSVPLLLLADGSPEAPIGLTLTHDAAAIIGAPFTPMSYAGVARRTTRRVVAVEATATTSAIAQQQAATAQQQQAVAQQQAATAQQQQAVAQQQAAAASKQAGVAVGTVVPALPSGCSPTQKGGVEYYRCGSVYYRSAFQGSNLVYVVVQQP